VVSFQGEIALEALRPDRWTPDEKRAFAALIAYSAYCGTGGQTTLGMGVTLPVTDIQDGGPAMQKRLLE
jgi:CRISPR/Cas system endoribonuclease Cas6 (RAMP superfamily)